MWCVLPQRGQAPLLTTFEIGLRRVVVAKQWLGRLSTRRTLWREKDFMSVAKKGPGEPGSGCAPAFGRTWRSEGLRLAWGCLRVVWRRKADPSILMRYGLAAGCVLVAFVWSYVLTPLDGSKMPLVFFVVAALVATWHGGIGPGLGSLAAGGLAGHYFLLPAAKTVALRGYNSEGWVVLTAYMVTIVFGVVLIDRLQRLRQKALAAVEKEHQYREQLGKEVQARHAANEERRRTEEALGGFLEDAPVGIYWVGLEGIIQCANREYLRMLGYGYEEVFGHHLGDFMLEGAEAGRGFLARLLDKGERLINQPMSLRCRDGSIREVSIDADVVREGSRFIHIRCFVRDVTERNRAELRLRVQYSVSRIVAEAPSLEKAVPEILRMVCQNARWEMGALWRVESTGACLVCAEIWIEGHFSSEEFQARSRVCRFASSEGLPGRVWANSEAIWVRDVCSEDWFQRAASAAIEGLASACAFPIQFGGQFFGVMEFLSRETREPDREFLQMMGALGREIGQFIERGLIREKLVRAQTDLEERVERRTADLKAANAELERQIEERHRLEKELIEITEAERVRIGQNLHDDLGQRLTGIALLTKSLGDRLAKRKAKEAMEAAKIETLVNETISHTRELSRNLTSVRLGGDDLAAALEMLATQTRRLFNISCRFKTVGVIPKLDEAVARQFYNISQEAVTNAIRHGKARHISIRLSSSAEEVVLVVRNNGEPFAPEARAGQTQGMGLRIMNYRASIVGAQLKIGSNRKRGALVVCVLPVKQRLLPGLGAEWR